MPFNSGEQLSSASKIGTIRWNTLEGGFFEIEADRGERYSPINLPGEFQKDGLRVRFSERLHPEQISLHMAGQIIALTSIEKL